MGMEGEAKMRWYGPARGWMGSSGGGRGKGRGRWRRQGRRLDDEGTGVSRRRAPIEQRAAPARRSAGPEQRRHPMHASATTCTPGCSLHYQWTCANCGERELSHGRARASRPGLPPLRRGLVSLCPLGLGSCLGRRARMQPVDTLPTACLDGLWHTKSIGDPGLAAWLGVRENPRRPRRPPRRRRPPATRPCPCLTWLELHPPGSKWPRHLPFLPPCATGHLLALLACAAPALPVHAWRVVVARPSDGRRANHVAARPPHHHARLVTHRCYGLVQPHRAWPPSPWALPVVRYPHCRDHMGCVVACTHFRGAPPFPGRWIVQQPGMLLHRERGPARPRGRMHVPFPPSGYASRLFWCRRPAETTVAKPNPPPRPRLTGSGLCAWGREIDHLPVAWPHHHHA